METLTAGQRLDHYEIIKLLGRGAFSETYEARDQRDGRLVVLKCPDPALLGDQAVFERFRRELAIGRLLKHPHIQQGLDTGENRTLPYLVLEYVEGERFRDFLERRGRLEPDEAVGYAHQLADALSHAHSLQVYHRDLKPENVLITADSQRKIIDFGIAFMGGARRLTWRWLSSTLGTPDDMSPEQIQGGRGDARSDIYAVGAMLYEMLTGRPPYQGDNALAVMNQHLSAAPLRPSRLVPSLPSGLDGIVLKALRKDPRERYQSAAELIVDLDRFRTLRFEDFSLPPEAGVSEAHPDRSLLLLMAGLSFGFLALAGVIMLVAFLVIHH
jgi:eukaryotic-like serine/threonine-protein kinase